MRGFLIVGLSLAVTVGLAQPAVASGPDRPHRLTVQKSPSVPPGKPAPKIKQPPDKAALAALKKAPAVSWPKGSATTVSLGKNPVTVAGTPITLAPSASAPSSVRVDVLDHARGLRFRVARADAKTVAGKVGVTVDYASFANAYGADYADRLQLVDDTTGATVPSTNNVSAKTVTATIAVPAAAATTLTLTAGSSSPAGDFTATPLKASETWSAGGQSGDFSWSYPMRTPPATTGPQPSVALSYSSQSVDGEMAASNNQPSWVGEGFAYSPGSITRNYKACADDMGSGATNTTKTGDLCWGSYNATLSLAGHSSEVIRNDADGHYSLKDDDGSKVELLTGATNGDNDGEYWRVTTTDGTQYYFGLNHITGWAAGNPTTNSAWTVPVYGNNSGEPCYNATFSSASCSQAWRWNLDYVVDPHGNTMSLWYTQESNNYARNLTSTTVSSYVRGGYLTRIDYGTDQHSGKDSDLSVKAPDKVDFVPADRCVTAGATCTPSTPSNWPDVPWDQNCTSTSSCTDYSPTFFTQKRLDTVQTSVWNATTSAYDPVEKWTLHQSYPDPGDSTRAGLWLSSISHAGLYGGSATVPDVTFDGIQLHNRIDVGSDNLPVMNWWRISAITTESGDKIGVSYSSPACVAGSYPTESSNTSRCYPAYWTRPGNTSPSVDWFNKYVVTAVSENDLTGGAPRIYTAYTYGTPAWHYDEDDGLVPAKNKTWGQWRGYDTVTTTVGNTGAVKTSAKVLYFQGMNGDKAASGTKSVQVTDSTGTKVNDDNAYAGMTRETITSNGPGGAEVSGEIDDPWKSTATATRTINGVTVSAYRTGTTATKSRVDLDGGRGTRNTETDTTLDAYGMPTQVWDKGDTSTSGDDTCEITTYNRNTTANILTTAGRVQKYAKPCGTSPASQDDVISDVENSYDGQAYGMAPTKGDLTTVQTAKTWTSATNISWLTTSTSVYDAYGRLTDATDVRGNHTLTAYTPATGGPITSVKTTQNPLGWVTTKDYAPGFGLPTASVDANNKRTDTTYDPLGRQSAIWTPTRSKAANATANATFSYAISQTSPSVVTTNTLDAASVYVPSYTFYDGLLRQRQVQAPSISGGRQITDTFYDTLGQTAKTSGPYHDSTNAGTTLFPTPLDVNVPAQTVTTYDGAGRAVKSAKVSNGFTQWHTTTIYGGDRTDVTPAADAATGSAGTPTSTYTDALGHTTEERRYPGTAITGTSYNSTTYAYNEKGQNTSVTDPGGNVHSFKYDLLGRQISTTDPDTGTSTSTFSDAGDLLTTTDARGTSISFDYTLPAGYTDPLGRKTAEWQGAVGTGTKLATWTYDTLSKGYVTSSSRFVGTAEYKNTVIGYNNLYQSAGTTTTIPGTEDKLAGTYTISSTYNLDGTLNRQSFPATGDLPAENLNYSYDSATGHPYSLKTDYGGTTNMIVLSTAYDSYNRPAVLTFADNATAPYAQQSRTYDPTTGRLSEAKTIKSTTPSTVADVNYSYDAAGNILKAADTPSGGTTETQCYTYDGLQRLTSAWTPADSNCTTAASAPNLGGAAPYWKSWTFDGSDGITGSTGNRLTETTHTAAGDTTITSTYGQAAHPHAPSATTTTGTQTATASYSYDADGNTTSRPGTAGQQTLTWDAEGHLATVTDTSGQSSYIYDTDGNRLIAHDPTGTTLYLNGVELRLTTATNALTAQRYYTYAGQTVAQRTSTGLQFLTGDPNGTSTIAIADTAAQATVKRYQDPYGNSLTTTGGTWTGTKTFVGGDTDPTALIHEGAREYDPQMGRFISRDPIADPQQCNDFNGYSYAGNNPIVHADPSGLRTDYYSSNTDVEAASNVRTVEKIGEKLREDYDRTSHCTYVQGPICGHGSTSPNWHFNKPQLPRYKARQGTPPMSREEHQRNELGWSPCEWYGRESQECKASLPPPHHPSGSGGVCVGGAAGLWFWSGSYTLCYMQDDGGAGFVFSREGSRGITGGPVRGNLFSRLGLTVGIGPVGSTGTVQDQAGPFHVTNIGAGYGRSATLNHGTGLTQDEKPETTDTILFGAGTGIIYTGGDSDTTVLKYWHNK